MTPVMLTEQLRPGLAGVAEQTIPRMQELVAQCLVDPRVRRFAETAVKRLGAVGGDRFGEARALFETVRRTVRYTRDPSSMELLNDPRNMLDRISNQGWAAGDCDDHALLIATLGHAIRLPIVFCVVGPSKRELEHIYSAMALTERPEHKSHLLALDTAVPNPVFGRHVQAGACVLFDALPKEF